MKLEEYFKKNNLSPIEFAVLLKVSPATIYCWIKNRYVATQKKAERVELLTKGEVSVMDMRGKDDRQRCSI